MKKRLIPICALGLVAMGLTSCGTKTTDWTYANGLADGELGYVILVGEDGNPEAADRTKGCQDALQEIVDSLYNPTTKTTGGIKLKEYAVQTSSMDGQGWSDIRAGQLVETWFTQYKGKIDLIVSNNDGMAIAAQQIANVPKYTPIVGFDALGTACDMIIEGTLAGSVSQNGDDQALLVLSTINALLKGETITADFTYEGKAKLNLTGETGNTYAEHVLQTKFSSVTATNANELKPGKYVALKGDYSTMNGKKILVVEYNANDNFISETYHKAFPNYAGQMGAEITIIQGDGNNDADLQERVSTAISQAGGFDAYAFNIITHTNYQNYINLLPAEDRTTTPIVFFNRQPMSSTSTTADISDLSNVYYVGSGSTGQGLAQGQILKDYFLKFNASNADGH